MQTLAADDVAKPHADDVLEKRAIHGSTRKQETISRVPHDGPNHALLTDAPAIAIGDNLFSYYNVNV